MLKFIQKNLLVLIILVISAGLFNVKFFGGYKFTSLICLWAALLMIYPSLVPLSFNRIHEVTKHKKILLLSVLFNFVLAPFLAYITGVLFLGDQPVLQLGLILLALLPGGGMVTTWALRSKADMPTTVGIVFVNLVLAIVIVPFGLSFAMNKLVTPQEGNNFPKIDIKREGAKEQATQKYILTPNNLSGYGQNGSVNVPSPNKMNEADGCFVEKTTKGIASCDFGDKKVTPIKIAIPIIFIILVPLILAFFTQKFLFQNKNRKKIKEIKAFFASFSNFGLLIILFILMSLDGNSIIFEKSVSLGSIFGTLLLFYGVIFYLIWFIYQKFYFNAQGKALLWGSYLRYITLALGLAISLVYQDKSLEPIILVVVLSYLIQIPSSYLIANLLKES